MKTNPLSKLQTAAICQVAHKAWQKLVTCGAESGNSNDEKDWRRSQQEDVLGAGNSSLTTATQHDYPSLYNHFATIAGLPAIKGNTYNDMDKLIWRVKKALNQHELDSDYLTNIAIGKFPRELSGTLRGDIFSTIRDHLSPAQIMQIVYTLDARGRAKTARIANQHDL